MANYYTFFDYCYKPEFCGMSATGLYPHEILLLIYIEKGILKKPYAKFWNDSYGVPDVDNLIASLTLRGYVSNNMLTDRGMKEIDSKEWVLKAHRNRNYGISMCTMSRLVSQNPGMATDQVIYNELTRRANLSIFRDPTEYVTVKEQMTNLFEDEKRYDCAIWSISEALYYQINVTSTQYTIDNKMLVSQENVEKLKNYLFAERIPTDIYIYEYSRMLNAMPKQGRVLSLHDSALLIVAYMEGKLNVIDAIYRRAKRVESDEYNYSEYDGNPILQSNTRSYPRPKNSVMIHLILFFLTLGFGNIIYYLCVRSGQKEWDRKYSSFQKRNKQPTHNRLKYPELKESDFEEVIEYQSNLMHQSLSVLRNKNSYILVLPVNAQLFEITLANARTLNTDVVEASHFHGCCAECAKRRGRWFSLTGKDTRFPLLDINYDCSCTGLDYDPVIPGVSVPEYGPSNERKYIIYFNRQMTDDRTQTELKTYNKTIEDFKTEFLRCTNSNNREIDFRIKVCTLIK